MVWWLGLLRGRMEGAVELARGERVDRVLAGKEPDQGPRDPPPVAQEFEQLRREHRIAILAALALLDADEHALRVDIADLERHDFRHPQPSAIGRAQSCLVLGARGRLEKASHFRRAQDEGYFARLVDQGETPGQIDPIEGDGEEEAQGRDRRVAAGWGHAAFGQVQLELPHILRRGGLRRAAEEGREASDLADVISAGLLDEMAHRHVIDHALAQRADGCLGHRRLLS